MPHEAFLKAMGNIKDEPGKYESLKKAGHSPINALYFLCQLAWRKKQIPKGWRESTIFNPVKVEELVI